MWFPSKTESPISARLWTVVATLIVVAITVSVAATVATVANAALPPQVIGEFQTFNMLAPSPLVQRAQELLTELGNYDGPTDGRMNDDTLEALKAYQRRSGLEDDGGCHGHRC
jgi:peptidoglycan hydrolase-like protein with peptidoglycan-binding domain